MIDHYRIDTPGIISFSGGATSGFMLWQVLRAYGGTLPDDIKVVFANGRALERMRVNTCNITDYNID